MEGLSDAAQSVTEFAEAFYRTVELQRTPCLSCGGEGGRRGEGVVGACQL